MANFYGELAEIKEIVSRTGIAGAWTEHDNSQHRFSARTGAVLCWWDGKKKTLLFQGPQGPREALEAAFNAAQASIGHNIDVPLESVQQDIDPKATRVFLVHGHDDVAREQLERILMILGLEPFVLQNTSGDGLTIIEALERQIGKEPEAKFGIVLMTPDDVGYSNKDGDTKADARARQNVVLEMGMLISSLTRSRVAILVKGHVELPSDAHGILYLHFNNHVKEQVPRLAERLISAGFEIDAQQIMKATS
ncbi:TIR domain-containing protein [Sphingomonas sp.]|uniref:TIR domain-containing protein n=1 Tax=Sphingomonas sp. TaxID=28214 RepID=UPI0035AF7EB6